MSKLEFFKKLIATFCVAAIVGTVLAFSVGAFGVTNKCLNSKIIIDDLNGMERSVGENINKIVASLANIKKTTNEIVNIVLKQAKNVEQIQKFQEVQLKILEEVKEFDEIKDVDNPYHLLEIRENIDSIEIWLSGLKSDLLGEESSNSNNTSNEKEFKCFCSIENMLSRLLQETLEIISEENEKKFQHNNSQKTTEELKELSNSLDEHIYATEKYLQKVDSFFKCIFEKIYQYQDKNKNPGGLSTVIVRVSNCNDFTKGHFKEVESKICRYLSDSQSALLEIKKERDNIKNINNKAHRKYLYKYNIRNTKQEVHRLIHIHCGFFAGINRRYENIIGVDYVSVLDMFEPDNEIFDNCKFDEMIKYD